MFLVMVFHTMRRGKEKNDKETHLFIDQRSARYWKLSSPKYYNMNTSPLTFCTPRARKNPFLAPPLCSSYSRILHDKDKNYQPMPLCSASATIALTFYSVNSGCVVCALYWKSINLSSDSILTYIFSL